MSVDSLTSRLTSMSDQNRISPSNINTILGRQMMRIKIKYQFGNFWLILYQILRNNFIRIAWQTVRKITHEILGVKGLRNWFCWNTNCSHREDKIKIVWDNFYTSFLSFSSTSFINFKYVQKKFS